MRNCGGLNRDRGAVRRLLLSAAFAGALLPHSAGAQSELGRYSYGDPPAVTVTVTGTFSQSLPSGHYPVLVEIDNRSGEEFSADLSFTARQGRYRWEEKFETNFRVSAPKASSKTHSLLVPLPLAGTSSSMYYGGYGSLDMNLRAAGRVDFGNVGGGLDLSYPIVAFGEEASDKVRQHLKGDMQHPSSSRMRHHSTNQFGVECDPLRLPTDWLAYSGLDAMVMTEDDWGLVPPGARSAILDWVRLGGGLVFYPSQAGRSFEMFGVTQVDDQDTRETALGLGTVIIAEPIGAGDVDTDPAKLLPPMGKTRSDRFLSDYGGSWQPARDLGRRRLANAQVVIILLLFGVLVGPVNLFVWAKPGRRHRLFFTTPLISIGASLLLAALILIQDGFGGKGSRNTLIYADPFANKAYVVQEQASRTGVLLRTNFAPEPRSLMVPLEWGGAAGSSMGPGGPSGNARSFRLRGDRHSGDWFSSRSDQAQYVESVVPSRARLERQPGPGNPRLTSSFPFPLERLFYIDADGDCWTANGVGTGATATLSPVERPDFDTWLGNQSLRFGDGVAKHIRGLSRGEGPAGSFFATAADAGSLSPESLPSIRWNQQLNLLTGPVVPLPNP